MSIQLPDPPPALPADTYAARHTTWWQACYVILKEAELLQHAAMPAEFANAMTPTLQAWNALDARLLALTEAIGGPQASGDGVSEATLLEALRITNGNAAAQA